MFQLANNPKMANTKRRRLSTQCMIFLAISATSILHWNIGAALYVLWIVPYYEGLTTSQHHLSHEKAILSKFTKREFTPSKQAVVHLKEPSLVVQNQPSQLLPTRGWWSEYADKIKRVYRPLSDSSRFDWCIPLSKTMANKIPSSSETTKGLLYVKIYHSAPSIGEGITISMARHVAQRLYRNKTTVCQHYYRHEFSDSKGQRRRDMPSLAWAVVRYPAERDLTEIFYQHVSREGLPPTDKNLQLLLKGMRGRQTRYLVPDWSDLESLKLYRKGGNHSALAGLIQDRILDNYDFLAIAERLEESLAVMKLLWNLELSDLIVLSSYESIRILQIDYRMFLLVTIVISM